MSSRTFFDYSPIFFIIKLHLLISWTSEVSGGKLRQSFIFFVFFSHKLKYVYLIDNRRRMILHRKPINLVVQFKEISSQFSRLIHKFHGMLYSEIESWIDSVVGNESVIGMLRKSILRIESFENHAREVSKAMMVIICLFYWCEQSDDEKERERERGKIVKRSVYVRHWL